MFGEQGGGHGVAFQLGRLGQPCDAANDMTCQPGGLGLDSTLGPAPVLYCIWHATFSLKENQQRASMARLTDFLPPPSLGFSVLRGP